MIGVSTQRLQANFSRAAEQYDARADLQHEIMQSALQRAFDLFPMEGRILDIGCGTGRFAIEAHEIRPAWEIFGLDIAPGMCAKAASRCNGVIEADAMALPFADGCMDGIFSSLCLQWVNDKPAALAEIARVLKPGAYAVLTTLGSATLNELRSMADKFNYPLGLLAMESVETYQSMLPAECELIACESTIQTRHYPTTPVLLNSMRLIGAGNAFVQPRLASVRQLKEIIANYEQRYPSVKGVYASWEPIFIVLKKRTPGMKHYFITGTGTGVGKTFFTCALIHAATNQGLTVNAFKPIISGMETLAGSDTGQILAASGLPVDSQQAARISPWQFNAPLSPDMAAAREGKKIIFDELVAWTHAALEANVDLALVEGVGGAMVPLDDTHTTRDWMKALDIPVILVSGSYLGAISHTLATLEALRAASLPVAALVVSESDGSAVGLEDTVKTLRNFTRDIPLIIAQGRVSSWRDATAIAALCRELS